MQNIGRLKMLGLGVGTLLVIGVWIFLLQQLLQSPAEEEQEPPTHTAAPEQQQEQQQEEPPQEKADSPTEEPLPSEQPIEKQPETYDEISVIFPPFIDEQAVAESMQLIEETYQVEAKWRVLDSMDSYKQAVRIMLTRDTGVDMVVVPTDRADSFVDRGYKIPFPESIASLFHPLLRPYIDNPDYTYLPMLIDPAVSIVHNQQFSPDQQITLANIQSALSTPRKAEETYLPMLFGFNEEQLLNLEQAGSLPFVDQQTILKLFFEQAVHARQPTFLTSFVDSPYWSYSTFTTQVEQSDSSCKRLPFLCFIARSYSDIYFGWMSDWSLLQSNFSQDSNRSYHLNNFPTAGDHYPLRGRGLIIKKDSPDLVSSLQWTKGYLTLLLERKLPVRNTSTLAADNETRQRQLIEERHRFIRPHINNGYMLQGTIDSFDQIIQQSNLVDALQGEYNMHIFLQKTSKEQ